MCRGQTPEYGEAYGMTWHPKAVLDVSRSVPESAPSAQSAQDRNFTDLLSLFDRFFNDFHFIFVQLWGCVFCFFFARSLTALDRQHEKKKACSYRLSPAFCCMRELARTISIIHSITCDPAYYTLLQGKCT